MAASLDRRAAISASTFCRSTLMGVAPAASFLLGWSKASFSSRKSIGPGKPLPGPMMNQCPPEGGWGRRVLISGIKGHKPELTVRPTRDVARDNLGLWRDCKPAHKWLTPKGPP